MTGGVLRLLYANLDQCCCGAAAFRGGGAANGKPRLGQDARPMLDDGKKNAGEAGRRPPPLLPILEGIHDGSHDSMLFLRKVFPFVLLADVNHQDFVSKIPVVNDS